MTGDEGIGQVVLGGGLPSHGLCEITLEGALSRLLGAPAAAGRLRHATALRELSRAISLAPPRLLYDRTLAELTTRTSQYPVLSVGDLVARCFHEWDNIHGLDVDGGGVVFGDGHIDEGATTELALAAARAGRAAASRTPARRRRGCGREPSSASSE